MKRIRAAIAGTVALWLPPVPPAAAYDGVLAGNMECATIPGSPGFSIPMAIVMRDGAGGWALGEAGKTGHQSVGLKIEGEIAVIAGSYNVEGDLRPIRLVGRVGSDGIGLAGKRGPRHCSLLLGRSALSFAKPPFNLAFDAASIREKAPVHAIATCRKWPRLGPDLSVERFYADDDPSFSRVIPERMAVFTEAVKPLREIERLIMAETERALGRGEGAPAAGRCVIEGLDMLARSDALLGNLTLQATFERKWSLVLFAAAFAETRDRATPEEATRIRRWISAMGDAMVVRYARNLLPDRIRQRNNHTYWTALSATMAGVAVDDAILFDFGVGTFRAALADIDSDGFLANELARKGKAFQYHKFSLEPLLLTALLAQANGVKLTDDELAALRRLARQVLIGLDDRSAFVAKTGVEQTLVGGPSGNRSEILRGDWAFAELLPHVLPDLAIGSRLNVYRPLTNAWLGGNLTLRYGR